MFCASIVYLIKLRQYFATVYSKKLSNENMCNFVDTINLKSSVAILHLNYDQMCKKKADFKSNSAIFNMVYSLRS